MKVKLAAIGVGNRTGKYLQYFQEHSDQVELVAIVEPNAIRRETCRKWFSLPEESCFESAESFFGKGIECDGVIIGSPDRCHYEQALMAIEGGMHILLEKPIAQNYEQCREIADAAARKGVKVGVCYVLRFHVRQLVLLVRIVRAERSDRSGIEFGLYANADVPLYRPAASYEERSACFCGRLRGTAQRNVNSRIYIHS